ncbi:hypothetical protein, partial [Lysobacter capsici]|uniref:hypothetical protein n=1 Tax=Lysobacter capsici TaxID=435897 RepID=UPI00398C94A3
MTALQKRRKPRLRHLAYDDRPIAAPTHRRPYDLRRTRDDAVAARAAPTTKPWRQLTATSRLHASPASPSLRIRIHRKGQRSCRNTLTGRPPTSARTNI